MCGRFALTTPHQAVAQHFAARPLPDALPARGDIRPTQPVDVVVGEAGGRVMARMRWGFLPEWYGKPGDGPLLINARSESIAEKPAFARACRETRCLIPANGFYEWRPGAAPAPTRVHWLAPEGEALFAFAGVWRLWTGAGGPIASAAIVTCAANARLSAVHHRMPVVIGPQDYGKWLGEAGKGAAVLMRPAAEDFFAITPGRGPA